MDLGTGIGVKDQPVVGIGELPFASMGDLGLDKAKVIQCALSRICGVCAESLGRPIAFLGSAEEAGRNEFHFPPAHLACAELALETWAREWSASLGQAGRPGELDAGDHLGLRVHPDGQRRHRQAAGVLAELGAERFHWLTSETAT